MSVSKQFPHHEERDLSSQGRAEPDYRFLALMQETTDLFWILTPTGEMREVCSSWQTFTGQGPGHCLGRRWLDAVHPANQARVTKLVAQVVLSGHIAEMECHLRWRDGSYRVVHLRVIPVRLPGGEVRELIMCGTDITKPERFEQMSESQMQLAMKAARVGTWDWDCITNQLVWTDQEKALFGWSPKAPVTHERFLAAIHPADREHVERIIARALIKPGEHCVEYRTIWPDGSVHWLLERARCICDANGRALHFIGATVDITDLRHTEEKITTILESITDGFMHLDTQWRYIYANPRVGVLLEKKPEELPGQCIWDVIPELLGTPFEQHYREALATQQAVHFEALHPTLQRWLEVHAYPIHDGLSVYLHDVTERKQVEESLRESERRFRALVDSNILGIIVSDPQGNIYEANDAFLKLVGYSREDLAAGRMLWTAMTPPEYLAQSLQSVEEVLTTGVIQPFEKEYLTKEGKRVPVLLGSTILRREGASPLMIAFVLDLTASKEIERQKDLMLGVTSHELKTPLAALKGTFQLLQRRAKRLDGRQGSLPPEVREFLQDLSERLAACVRQVDVQTHLINDLLDVSRITAGTLQVELERCDLISLVRETVEDLRVIAPERPLKLFLPERFQAIVLADRARISQVVTNYVTNALRYTRPDQPIHIGLTLQEKVVRVWVQDKGPGLTEEAQKHLWQRFHQVKGVPVQNDIGKGLGLGLYICQTLVAQHQGEVGVESTPGEGSTFWFTVPLLT